MRFLQRCRYVPCALLIGILGAHAAATAWQVQSVVDQTTQTKNCVLSSEVVTISDGYDQTQVGLHLQRATLFVSTTSPLDAGFADLGLQVDRAAFLPGDKILGQRTVIFETPYAAIIEQFRKGSQVRVQLRFWPTWPTTGPHNAIISLKGFRKAYEALLACE